MLGGRTGLPVLKSLSEDPSLSLEGRQLARDVHKYVSEGRHLGDIEEFLKPEYQDGLTCWQRMQMKYTYSLDSQ
jgi:hypothetical protein